MQTTKEFTLILYVNDVVGMLANVLNKLSTWHLSVLTIHQSIPMKNRATITLSLDATDTDLELDDVVDLLKEIDNVTKVELISMTI